MTAPLLPLFVIVTALVLFVAFVRGVMEYFRARSIDVGERAKDAARGGYVYLGELVRSSGLTPALDWSGKPALLGLPFVELPASIYHMNFLGDSRTGKTQGIWHFLRQEVFRGSLIFVLDNKGSDPDFWAFCEGLCRREAHADFYYFSAGFDECSHTWNVLRDIAALTYSPERFASTLGEVLGCADSEEAYFASIQQELIQQVILAHPEAQSLSEFAEIISDPEFFETLPRNYREHSTHLRSQLARYGSIPALNPSGAGALSIPDLVYDNSPGIVYARLYQTPEIGRLLLELVRRACAQRAGRAGSRRVIVVIDEVQFMVSSADYLAHVLTTSASSGLSIVTAHQGLSQFEGNRALQSVMRALPTIYYGSNDGVTNDFIVRTWRTEWWNEDELTDNVTYQSAPEIAQTTLRFLCRSPNAKGLFMAMLPRGSVNPGYSFGRSLYATSTKEYEALRKRGWPKDGELPGTIHTPSYEFFQNRKSLPPPPRDESLRGAVEKAISEVIATRDEPPRGGTTGEIMRQEKETT